MTVLLVFPFPLSIPPGGSSEGIDKGEGSVTVCLFSVPLSTSSLATSRWV